MANNKNRWLVWALTIPIALAVTGFLIYKRYHIQKTMDILMKRRAEEIAAVLNAGGAKVGEPQLADDVKGVEQVVVLEVDGKPVRLLEFDPAKEGEAEEVKHVHEAHATSVLGKEQPAEDEGPIVIVDFDQHPDKDRILEAFHKTGSAGK